MDEFGGAEKVCHNSLKALLHYGNDVELLSFDFDKDKYYMVHGESFPEKVNLQSLGKFPLVEPPFSIYKRNSLIKQAVKKHYHASGCEVLFSTQLFTHFEHLVEGQQRNVAYVHFPEIHFEYANASMKRRAYLWMFKREMTSSFNCFESLFCNSVFTQAAIKKYLGLDATVIYPPVNLDKYWCSDSLSKRSLRVVTIGRFIATKRHDLMNVLARRFPSIEFVSVGGLPENQVGWFNNFKKGLAPNYSLLPNLSNDELIRLLHSSRVYLHLMENEHFGLSPVEALACGCVPIVHDSGGMREFLPLMLRWRSFEELPNILGFALQMSDAVWSVHRSQLWRGISVLDFDVFENQLCHNLLKGS